MPISFEEVTAEVPPDRPAPPAATGSAPPEPGASEDAATERLQRALALRREREWRHRAD